MRDPSFSLLGINRKLFKPDGRLEQSEHMEPIRDSNDDEDDE